MEKVNEQKIDAWKDTISSRISFVRASQKLNQIKFGEAIGITQVGVSEIERGEYHASMKVVLSIIDVFKINVHWLLYGEGEVYTSVSLRDSNKKSEFVQMEFEHLVNIGAIKSNVVKHIYLKLLQKELGLIE